MTIVSKAGGYEETSSWWNSFYDYEVFIGVKVHKDFMFFLTMSINIFVHLIHLFSEIYGQLPFLVQCGNFRLLQLNPSLS